MGVSYNYHYDTLREVGITTVKYFVEIISSFERNTSNKTSWSVWYYGPMYNKYKTISRIGIIVSAGSVSDINDADSEICDAIENHVSLLLQNTDYLYIKNNW